tara:strand:- start:85 stop:570 length:486 start_codon:yes stop_codon:yes gene_type:complete
MNTPLFKDMLSIYEMSKTGLIYRITDGHRYYYGSTSTTLKRRLSNHSASNSCISKILYENGMNPTIELVEKVMYDNIGELRLKEAEYIENFECINIQNPKRVKTLNTASKKEFDKQYYIDKVKNNDIEKERRKLYRRNNKDKLNARRRELRQLKKIQGSSN